MPLRTALLSAAALCLLTLCLLAGPAGFGLPSGALLELRLGRLLTGFTVGAALACSGCALQAVLRNPLAEPYVLGVSSGGSLGAALAIATGLSAVTPLALPACAFLAAGLTLLLVCLLGGRAGGYAPNTLILVGVVAGTMLSSLVMLVHALDVTHRGHSITWWMMGNLQTTSRALLAAVALLVALAAGVLLAQAKELNALLLGAEAARHLGVRTRLALPLTLGAATLATAAAVSVSGIIGFVGLIVPHALRRLTGADHRTLLPGAALCGGTFLVLCDTLARLLLAPREIPVGVVTALSGGPFFLYLLGLRASPPAHARAAKKADGIRSTGGESGEKQKPGDERHTTPAAASPPPPLSHLRRCESDGDSNSQRDALDDVTFSHFQKCDNGEPGQDAILLLEHVSAAYGPHGVLDDVSLRVARGERVALVGPNGAGKSSLLRVVTGQLPARGAVGVAGIDPAGPGARALAKRLAVVPQEIPRDLPFTARGFVLLGRTPWLPRFGGPAASDLDAVREAMELTETWHLRGRPLPEMSGGERQRLTLAMALAARPEILLLDEPTSHLDLRHRAELMELLLRLNRERQLTLLMVIHDLTLASQFFPRVVLLGEGRKLADGPPAEVLRPDLLEAAYGCPVSVIPLPGSAAVCVLPRL
jgi:iron complex transport system permease protein